MLKTPRNTTPRARILDPNNTDIGTAIPINAAANTAVNWVFTASANGEYTFLFEALEDTVACRFFIYDVQITHVGQVLDCELVQGYRYGFNGMEKDDELKGKGNSYDFGARILDPRLGRWLSRDPLEAKYPDLSTYCFVANNPLRAYDPDGCDIIDFIQALSKKNELTFKDQNGKEKTVYNSFQSQLSVLRSSTVFMNFLAQYADINSKNRKDNNSSHLGFTANGRFSHINLRFESKTMNGKGAAAITFKGKSLGECKAEDLKGCKPEDFEILISLANHSLDGFDNPQIGDKLLTITHELCLHGETLTAILDNFVKSEITPESIKQLLAAYEEACDGGGELDHLKITPGTASTYEAVNDDLEAVMSKGNNPQAVVTGQEKTKLYSTYGKFSLQRTFTNGMLDMLSSFKYHRHEEKDHGYNPNKRCRTFNYLKCDKK